MTEIPSLLDAIKALGVAGGPVFAILWWLERTERRACQQESKALLTQVLNVASQAAISVTEVTKAVSLLGESTRDTVTSLAKLGELVRALATQARKVVR